MLGLIVDLFAGGGGASIGLMWALGRSPDIAINHNAEALAMHAANHPNTRHLINDITRVLPLEATGGRPVDVLHASPDCCHFSKAKGGKPRSQYIRDLAWVVVRWAEDVRPRLITLENVEEFQTWGPLDAQGQPIKSQAGATFRSWVRRLRRLGYRVDWRELRACDYGSPTTRKRLFVVARRDGCPVVWPNPTHGDPKSAEVRAGKLLTWRTAAECIDWALPSRSIFDRKKPLALNTQRRIAEGIRRYVLNSPEPFIVTYYGQKKLGDFRGQDLTRPLPTQTTENRFGLVWPKLVTDTTGHAPTPVDISMPIPNTDNQQMVAGAIVCANHVADDYMPFRGQDVAEPLRTITQAPGFALAQVDMVSVSAPVLSRKFSKSIGQRVDVPHPTITQANHDMVLTAACMAKHYGGIVGHELGRPLGTVTTIDHHALTTATLIKYYGTALATGMDEPLHTVTAKDRMGLVCTELDADGVWYAKTRDWLRRWSVIEPDTEAEVKIQGVVYRIVDICMRMLAPRELYRAQGFPDTYVIAPECNGKPLSKTAQVRMCGNSVPPQLIAAVVKANGPETWIEEEKSHLPLMTLIAPEWGIAKAVNA